MDRFSNLYSANTPFLEEMFNKFQIDPDDVPSEWRTFFTSVQAGQDMVESKSPTGLISTAQSKVEALIYAYRTHGHKYAALDPLEKGADRRELKLETYGLTPENLNEVFDTDGTLTKAKAPLNEIITALKTTYTASIGVQYAELPKRVQRLWLRNKMEPIQNKPTYAKKEKHRMFEGLLIADKFERFLHTKFIGKKRFSIEGGDVFIPMMDTLIDNAARHGIKNIIVGMSHRGRLNVLANIFHKPMEEIMAAFDDKLISEDTKSSGDVKYHMGKSYKVKTHSGYDLHLSLLNNPSHLEAINPVVAGAARAKQEGKYKDQKDAVLPLVIHGDSAFAGQGVVTESLNLSNLEGYSNGGTIHIVINNKIGFTANPDDTFSGQYCTDVARMLQVPIFHVNGDDTEACNHVMEMAFDWRNQFKKDVIIDIVCYRRYGHNEGDDPNFTQPVVYEKVKNHPRPVEVYKEVLLAEGTINTSDIATMEDKYTAKLQAAFELSKSETKVKPDMFTGMWKPYKDSDDREPKTAISKDLTQKIAKSLVMYPEGFTPNGKVARLMERRSNMLLGKEALDWGAGELTAYASLINEGINIRLSGQDVRRGTFTHRHAYMYDAKTASTIAPINTLAQKGAQFKVWNSSLSEYAVMGFEYGYSLNSPNSLVIWEAQFGDFANGAQIIFDQFLSATVAKWNRYSGLVVQLPHGQEGQGPEHSSGRLERMLQLCAEDNMTVANITTPAQIFHLLRRQVKRNYRKPLIIMTPKSLLRHPKAVSDITEFTSGEFQTIIMDKNVKATAVKKVIFCNGKLYYELLEEQEKIKCKHIALVRLEQLYPLDEIELNKVLKTYKKAKTFIWAQEEAKNQGAWWYMRENLEEILGKKLVYVGKANAASTACGSTTKHNEIQAKIIAEAFAK